jgi:hypothetical protein
MTEGSNPTRRRLVASAVAAASMLLVAIVLSWSAPPRPAPINAPPSPSPSAEPSDDVLKAESLDDLPLTLRPYPFTDPAPDPVPTEIDGTYMLILTLDDLGGATNALPFPCRRCLPYARDPGVTTLIFFQGAYFVDHQMSAFHSTGHYTIDGDRLTLFNDPNCSRERGTYTWQLEGGSLHLEALEDTCAYQGERATDLTTDDWTRIPVCKREVAHLWPGILGC